MGADLGLVDSLPVTIFTLKTRDKFSSHTTPEKLTTQQLPVFLDYRYDNHFEKLHIQNVFRPLTLKR